MNDEEENTCVSCHERPPAGYTCRAGQGVYLSNLCRKCWMKGDTGAIGKQPFSGYHNTKGKS